MNLRFLICLIVCLAARPAMAQNLGIRLLRPYDGTSANVVAARCIALNYSADVAGFTRIGSHLHFELRLPNAAVLGNDEFHDVFLALEHYVEASEEIGDSVTVTLTYRPAVSFPHDPPLSCTQTFHRQPQAAETPIPIESGWWVDFLKSHGVLGRGLMLDRGSGRIELRYLSFAGPSPVGAPYTQHPDMWTSGATRHLSSYLSIPMTHYSGGFCIPCFGDQRELGTPVGRMIFHALTPTTAILAPPNEPARLIEQAAFPSDRFPNRRQSSLTGRWAILGSEDALFGGFPIELGAEEEGQYFLSYPITFRFGSGRMHCDNTPVCKLHLRFTGLDREFLLFEIPEHGVGNQKLYVQSSQGTWRPVMVRID